MEKAMRESLLKSKDPNEAIYKNVIDKEFDYEINTYSESKCKYKEELSLSLSLSKLNSSNQSQIDGINESNNETNADNNETEDRTNNKNDSTLYSPLEFPDQLANRLNKCEKIPFLQRNWVKATVSKSKIRFINNEFDLDLIYMTNRVIGMGFPATKCESLYRNSLKDVKRLFKNYHNDKVKIYNLCLEKERIYSKEIFSGMKVGLFPASDHSACPVKMMLAFCVDICLYLLEDKENIAAVHCKAGKGRTGVMICAYLVFAGICEDMNKALDEYAVRRSHKLKGVTIPSQRRYLYHFETYLNCNFTKPYFKFIPRICKYHLTPSTNLLLNFFKDKTFTEFINIFSLKKIKIGPFTDKQAFRFRIENFKNHVKLDTGNKFEKVNYKYTIKDEYNQSSGKQFNYSILEFNENFLIDSDFNLVVHSSKTKFNCWFNLFFITLEFYLNLLIREAGNINNTSINPSNIVRSTDLGSSIYSMPFRTPTNLDSKIKSSNFVFPRSSELVDLKDMRDMKDFSKKKSIKESSFKELSSNTFPFNSKSMDGILNEDFSLIHDPNFYQNFDNEKVKFILNNFTNFNGENILNFDLNNLTSALLNLSSVLTSNFTLRQAAEHIKNKKRKFKLRLDASGLDKLKPKKEKLLPEFSVEVTYSLV